MAGGRRVRGVGAVALCLLVSLTGCGGRTAADSARSEVQHLLDLRSAALLRHDAGAYGATGASTEYTRLRALPLASWAYRITGLRRTAAGATVDADLAYKVAGYDRAPVDTRRTLTLARTASGTWYVTGDRPAGKSGQQLWDQGTVTAVPGAHSLVLGAGQPPADLRAYARMADQAVPAVTREWGTDWTRRVVVLVPKSLQGMAGLLGSPAANYRGIAAVTTGEAGGAGRTPADRVVINPDAYAVLGAMGKQVVLTHETTHVATRARTTAATPLWLSEGYADWIGYLGTDRTPTEAAPELARAVRDGHVPAALPADKDFGFTSDPTELAQAYESGWLACRMIADQWGAARLAAFYRGVGGHPQRPGAVESTLKQVLGLTPESFTTRWRTYVRTELR
ncbi:hypothetical protein Shyhy01_12460 [Streptomyces hygroscopicus subsp. hygroscopicus]|uniref:hypothetical protein n=1 Tax=Streptomyces sp. KHY 26 TaxID=3097359 RepID=UPI0024A0789A|nr:hypothetical protein [Streptomyces hygroscopicus]GLX48296.1 hypothetical protein Shyhy01_12460 [Streptomyces hygroscopicus subsp. hygroscopicus]